MAIERGVGDTCTEVLVETEEEIGVDECNGGRDEEDADL